MIFLNDCSSEYYPIFVLVALTRYFLPARSCNCWKPIAEIAAFLELKPTFCRPEISCSWLPLSTACAPGLRLRSGGW